MSISYGDLLEWNDLPESVSRSVVPRLAELLAIDFNLLEQAWDAMEESDIPMMAAFGQLPYPLNIEDDWYTIGLNGDPDKSLLKISLNQVVVDMFGRTHLSDYDKVDYAASAATVSNFCVLIPLWGRRGEYYNRYLNSELSQNPLIVPSELSWDRHLPMRSLDFEHNASRRYMLAASQVISSFITNYRIISKSNFWYDGKIFNYFFSPKIGRLTYHRPPVPVLSGLIKEHGSLHKRPIQKSEWLKNYKVDRHSNTEFEKGIFAAHEAYGDRNYETAVIIAAQSVELLLKERLQKPNKNLVQLLAMPEMSFLPSELQRDFTEFRRQRNRIIHEGETVNEAKTNFLLDIAFNLYRELNKRNSSSPP